MKRPNDFLFRVLVVVASTSLATLCLLVIYSVVMRYVFSDAPDFVEPIALLLVIVIAMFGAALKIRSSRNCRRKVKWLPTRSSIFA
jgi:TRAP-type C4-dicarboxylate transport system permease small subunit